MRDSNRLYYFYDHLRTVHMENFPDWRFGQFISNFIGWLGRDPFHIEEDEMQSEIDRFVKETCIHVKGT